MSGGAAEARVKGVQAVVGSGRTGFGEDADSGSVGRENRWGEEDVWDRGVDRTRRW